MHFCSDAFAVSTHAYGVPGGGTVPALSLTCLLATSAKVMLNYQTDDFAVVRERSCGCPLEACGYSTHLHGIRSYSKLVGEGVSLIGNEILNILENQLPARFGGTPLDYQLVEEEDDSGLTRIHLVISPTVCISDERQVVDFVLDALTRSSPMADAARRVWQQAQTLRIRRTAPRETARGKLLPLSLQKAGKSD
ncbi:MAG: hypothetical protein FJW35_11115 [Acidobacteria bacterium]|nr:hypothetical protein [Acidobacteriota bacterium]